MFIKIITFTAFITLMFLFGVSVHAQGYYYAPSPFQQGYDAATNYGRTPALGASIIAQQKNTEALVNAIRAQRGLPPCSIGLLGQWQGRPAC